MTLNSPSDTKAGDIYLNLKKKRCVIIVLHLAVVVVVNAAIYLDDGLSSRLRYRHKSRRNITTRNKKL